ncbi:spore protease YyaC [Neobacillus pocheonensis]|uniref:spore protease YyaC n=1 Tax=Neobacillus pocheonensis TaxID=363869 RepID=UPI003D2E243E
MNKKISKEEVERPGYISLKDLTEEKEIEKLALKLKDVLSKTNKEVIILCVGSDRSTGDSLGPIVGSMLKEINFPLPVYGTLEEPVHALNIHKILKNVKEIHHEPFIIGIDACLGEPAQIGSILFKKGPFFPGAALNKVLPGVGDYHLKAIVNCLDSYSPVQSLNSTRLYTVMKLSEILTKIIYRAVLDDDSFSKGPFKKLLTVED